MSERGDWERAAQVTGGVYRNWQERSFWLHALLRHSDTDQVLLLFRSVEEYLKLEEMDQYAAANAQLIAQLDSTWHHTQVFPPNGIHIRKYI